MAAIRVGKGRAAIELTGPLVDPGEIENDLREALGPVYDEILAKTDELYRNARRTWPVKTGKSRDSLTKTVTLVPGTWKVEGSVLSPLVYIRYIRSTKAGRNKERVRLRWPLQTELRKPAVKLRKELRVTLPVILADHLTDLVRRK